MLKRLSESLVRYARPPLVWSTFILSVLFPAVIFPWVARIRTGLAGEVGPIDLTFAPSAENLFSMVAAYGAEGRAFYRVTELTVDVVYPLSYGFFLSFLITLTFRRVFPAGSWMQRLNLVPLAGMLFDFLENFGIVGLLSTYPAQIAWLAAFTSAANTVKWIFSGGGALLGVVGALLFAGKLLFKK